jgi:hypothetical protein
LAVIEAVLPATEEWISALVIAAAITREGGNDTMPPDAWRA